MTGPAVVALGGGHGLSATLRAARRYAGDITAVVSVADDGGSSGRLRSAFGIPAPGDLRRCLVALADDSLWAAVFEHRFDAGELEGHAFGNLLIAALADYTGDFEVALHETGRLLGLEGTVYPATREPVVLKAEVEGASVEGQVAVSNAGRISFITVILTVGLATLVIGEITPKSIAIAHAERISLFVVYPIRWLQVATAPIVWLVTFLSNILVRPFGRTATFHSTAMSEEELKIRKQNIKY